jgi:hypothetical protein
MHDTQVNVPKGWTNERSESYAKALCIDPVLLMQQLHAVTEFTYLQPALTQTARLLNDDRIVSALNLVRPNCVKEIIKPWLASAVESGMSKVKSDAFYSTFIARMTSAVGTATMTMNVNNTLQQISGLVTAMTFVKPKYIAQATIQYVKSMNFASGNDLMADLANESVFFKARWQNRSTITNLARELFLKPENVEGMMNKIRAGHNQVSHWSKEQAYVLQKIVQDRLDTIVAYATMMQELEKGSDRAAAVRAAEQVVRFTQSSFDTVDKSALENGRGFIGAITQFQNYFYTTVGSQIAEWRRLQRVDTSSARRALGRAYALCMGLWLNNAIAQFIMDSMKGQYTHNEDMDWRLEMLNVLVNTPVNALINGVVPLAGHAEQMLWDRAVMGEHYFNDSVMNLPVATAMQNGVLAAYKGLSVTFGDDEKEWSYRDTRNVATLLSVCFGIPQIAWLGREASLWQGMNTGELDPRSRIDIARSLITSTASEDAKANGIRR